VTAAFATPVRVPRVAPVVRAWRRHALPLCDPVVSDVVGTDEMRRRQLPRAILIGIVVGGIAVAFNRTLAAADAARIAVGDVAPAHPTWGIVLPVLLGALGATVAVSLVRYVCPEASGSGIPQLKAVVHHPQTMRAGRVLGVKFAGGLIGIGAGLTLGRE